MPANAGFLIVKINKISINNYKSIEILKDLELSDFSIFVGQNNHGKTNLFEALDWFFSGKGDLKEISYLGDTKKEVKVELNFTGLKESIKNVKHEKHKKGLLEAFGEGNEITIRRTSTFKEGKELQLFNPKKKNWENMLGPSSIWTQILPSLEYISTKKYLEDIAKYGKTTPIGDMMAGVIETILDTNKDYSEFKEKFTTLFGDPEATQKTQIREELDKLGENVAVYLRKQFPDSIRVIFKVDQPDIADLLKKFSGEIDDGFKCDWTSKGDGMQRALMLSIIQAYKDYRKQNLLQNKDFLFLIDEAELHLHPTAQRSLKSALSDISETGDQVMINTHSSVFVVDSLNNQRIFKVFKNTKATEISEIGNQEKAYVIYDLLGGSPADLLLPNNFLIVEGRSEQIFLRTVIDRFYKSKPKIQIVYAESDIKRQERTMEGINKTLVPLYTSSPIYKNKLVIMCDKPAPKSKKEKDMNDFKKVYKNIVKNKQLVVLSKENIEELYPDGWRKTKQDVKALDKVDKGKTILAENCAENIDKMIFEAEMKEVFDTLKMCWDNAF